MRTLLSKSSRCKNCPRTLALAALALILGAAPRALRAQEGIVAGTVIDARSLRGLDGVQIAVLGTTTGTVTDATGRFRIQGLSAALVTLQLRRLGFRQLSEAVSVGRTDLRLAMTESPTTLNEVVVTGTAEAVQRRAIGNSIAKVDVAEIQSIAPAQDISNLINGRAPGVVISPGSGAVGSGPRIRIRGAASLSLNDQPLIYIDGVRVANDVSTGPRSQFFGSGVVSRLNDLDPETIESIEIIKGPSAATLYGTEANNGVIQIITKRGKQGRAQITATVRQGVAWFMDAAGRIPATLIRDPATSNILSWNPVEQEEARGTPLFKNGHLQSYTLGIGGGSETTRYHLNTSYDHDTGIEPTNSLWRFSGNANLQLSPFQSLDVNTSLGITQQQVNVPLEAGGGMWFSAFFGRAPLTDAERLRRGFFSAPPEAFWGAFAQYQRVNRITGSLQLNHRPVSWFSQRATFGTDLTGEDNVDETQRMSAFLRQFFTNPVAQNGNKFTRRREINYTTADYSNTLKFELPREINSSTSFGAQYYRRRVYALAARGEGFPTTGLTTVDAAATTFGGEDVVENTTLGFYGQQQFDLSNRIFLTGALRVDNNSAFGDNFSWIAYPKVSATWVINEEPWWRYSWVNALKLRAAYGQTGQQPEVFTALRTYAPVTGGNGQSAVTPQAVGNPDLKPERAGEIEVGFDAALLGDRLGTEFSYYNRNTSDAILLRDVAPSGGFPGQQFTNIGGIRSSGVELQLRANVLNRERFNWDWTFNIAKNDNEITDLGGAEFIQVGAQRNAVGQPVRSWYDYKVLSAEFGPTGQAINAICDDGKGGRTPCLNAAGQAIAPRVFLGRPDPSTEGSVSTTATLWRQLRLYGLIDFKRGQTQLDNNLRARCQVFQLCDENLNPTKYDPARIAQVQSPNILRNFVYNDASFAKLRELSASYSIPERLIRGVGVSGATITLTGRNLHTWTNWTGVDPESYFVLEQFVRLEQAQVPQLAQFVTSLSLTF